MKVKLIGIKNHEGYQFLVFKKDQAIIKLFKKIILEIDDQHAPLLECFEDFISLNSNKEVEESKLIEKEVNTIQDEYFNFDGKDYSLNIIFGNKKVFFYCSFNKKTSEKIMLIIRQECEFNDKSLC